MRKFMRNPRKYQGGFAAWAGAAAAVVGAGASIYAGNKSASAARDAAGKSASAEKYAANLQNQQYKQTRQDQMPFLNRANLAGNKLEELMGLGPQPGIKTRQQIRQELLPKFSTRSAPLNALASWAGPYTGRENPLMHPGGTGVDENALNAEVERQFQAQHATPNSDYGSLLHNFSLADFAADPGYKFRVEQGMNALNNSLAAKGGLLSGAAVKEAMRLNQGYATDEFQNAYNRFNTNQGNQYNRLASLANVGQVAAGTLGQIGSQYAGNLGTLAMTNAANQGGAILAGANARASGYQGASDALGHVDWKKLFSSTPTPTPAPAPFSGPSYDT